MNGKKRVTIYVVVGMREKKARWKKLSNQLYRSTHMASVDGYKIMRFIALRSIEVECVGKLVMGLKKGVP